MVLHDPLHCSYPHCPYPSPRDPATLPEPCSLEEKVEIVEEEEEEERREEE